MARMSHGLSAHVEGVVEGAGECSGQRHGHLQELALKAQFAQRFLEVLHPELPRDESIHPRREPPLHAHVHT